MKKLYFAFIFFVFCGFFVFGDNDKREEVDFLLFMPNSANRFVNEEQAFIQLNKLALFLSNKNLLPGQIIVCGYTAYAPNDVKSVDLSRERAFTVIEELQKRGISKELFADPVGYGAVYQWGNNTNENDRKLNRRVRILLDGESPMPVTHEIIAAETEPYRAEAINSVVVKEKSFAPEYMSKKPKYKFPWWVISVLLLLMLLFLLFKERSRKEVQSKNEQPQTPITENGHEFTPEEAVTTWMVNLDEEIRLRAYELSLERNGSGDYREQDWYNAVQEISTWYTACGHSVFTDGGRWWASRSHTYDFPATAVS
ncbi:MAG: OmpA family protein [Treponema sp.]|nr:OmpA family protein [Treponema sp.]